MCVSRLMVIIIMYTLLIIYMYIIYIYNIYIYNIYIYIYIYIYRVILNLHEWFTNNRLILNIDKTKVLPYKDANIIKAISINSTNICLVSSYTFLGVIIDNNLNFKEHIRKIQLKLSQVIYILRKLSYLPIYILKLLYNSLFLPHIMYCLEIWGNNFNNNLRCISTLQKRLFEL